MTLGEKKVLATANLARSDMKPSLARTSAGKNEIREEEEEEEAV